MVKVMKNRMQYIIAQSERDMFIYWVGVSTLEFKFETPLRKILSFIRPCHLNIKNGQLQINTNSLFK